MIKHNQSGAVSGILVGLILSVLLLITAIAFGAWAFSSRQDYKNNTDAKIDTAVQAAVAKNSTAKDKQFAEQEKNPLLGYSGPEALGSLSLKYPRTWSVYNNSNSDGTNLDLYFNPRVVTQVGNAQTVYALHLQVLTQSYATIVQGLSGPQQAGQLSVKAYSLPSLPKVVGVLASGKFADGSTGTMIIMPIRSDTLQVQTYSNRYVSDFNKYILKNLSFSP